MTTTSAAAGRWLEMEGGSNVRDLGGLPLVGGGETARGVLFRGDTPQEWTEHDLAGWRERALALVVDLRAPAEADAEGRAALDGVTQVGCPLIPDSAIVPGAASPDEESRDAEAVVADADLDERVRHYLGYFLGYGGKNLAAAVRALADADGPALFHCAAGKDRTGVLAAVVQELAGVEREAVVADYAATTERIEGVDARLRRLPTYSGALADVPRELLHARPEVMADLLEAVDERLGGVRGWVAQAGVPDEAVDRLAVRLRDGRPLPT